RTDTGLTPHHHGGHSSGFQLIIAIIVRHAWRLPPLAERFIQQGIGGLQIEESFHPFIEILAEENTLGVPYGDRHGLVMFMGLHLGGVPLHHCLPPCRPLSGPRDVRTSFYSCRIALVVFQEPSKAFTTPQRTCVRLVLADGREEQHVALTLMIALVMT